MDVPRRGSGTAPRMLYWFRTPPGVKVGRQPFDPESRRVLQAEYPELTFDWDALAAARMAKPASPGWRGRRGERPAKGARTGSVTREGVDDAEPGPATPGEDADDSGTPPGGLKRGAGRRRRRRRRPDGGPAPEAAPGGLEGQRPPQEEG
jgi:hypothetical protein